MAWQGLRYWSKRTYTYFVVYIVNKLGGKHRTFVYEEDGSGMFYQQLVKTNGIGYVILIGHAKEAMQGNAVNVVSSDASVSETKYL